MRTRALAHRFGVATAAGILQRTADGVAPAAVDGEAE